MGSKANLLPTVQWGGHSITRLLLGHNPQKGTSHLSRELDAEMTDYFDPAKRNDLELLKKSEECGINTAQMGGDKMQSLIHRHKEAGGGLQWIATLYDSGKPDFDTELKEILSVDPKPIGIQYYAGTLDKEYFEGRLGGCREKIKKIRDAGVLTGAGTHLADVVKIFADEDWDVDFYQTCAYTVYVKESQGEIDRDNETFDTEDRAKMLQTVSQVSKPCLLFKILGATRNCGSDEEIEKAFRLAYDSIKPSDVVLVGMWQKYRDQVTFNTDLVRRILDGQ